jgi:hypothetical protein
MTALTAFLQALLKHGTVVFREPPVPSKDERAGVLPVLQRAFADYRLDIAGPRLEFQADTALAAAELLRQACWFLVHRGAPAEEVERQMTLAPPASTADHLSADLLLRFIPQVHRRARGVAPDDPLTARLAQALRHWPLSGVLSDVVEPPLTPPDFDGHAGLQMLYAERLARNEKAGWLPGGRAFEHVELVYRDLGRERSAFLERNGDGGS